MRAKSSILKLVEIVGEVAIADAVCRSQVAVRTSDRCGGRGDYVIRGGILLSVLSLESTVEGGIFRSRIQSKSFLYHLSGFLVSKYKYKEIRNPQLLFNYYKYKTI